MSKKLSIIIPAYNASHYLKRCIESCVPLLNTEIIIVNDGSTDSTLELANELSLKYDNVKVINQKKLGVSVARNVGISCADGDWLFFVDADDWINASELDELLKEVSLLTDCIVNFGCSFVYKNEKIRHNVQNGIFTSYQLLNSGYFQLATWNYLFPSSLIKDNGIVFPEGVICNEDQAFNIKAIATVGRVLLRDYNVYYYNQTNVQSASHCKHRVEWREGKLKAANDIILYCVKNHLATSTIKNQIRRMFESYINDDTTSMSLKQTFEVYDKYYDFVEAQIDGWNNICPLLIFRKIPILGYLLYKFHKSIKG